MPLCLVHNRPTQDGRTRPGSRCSRPIGVTPVDALLGTWLVWSSATISTNATLTPPLGGSRTPRFFAVSY